MLESKDLGGKCADLDALYVGLARAVGLPAHDVYGIRVAKSELGYKSLGPSENVTKTQHCRALRADGNGPRSAVRPGTFWGYVASSAEVTASLPRGTCKAAPDFGIRCREPALR